MSRSSWPSAPRAALVPRSRPAALPRFPRRLARRAFTVAFVLAGLGLGAYLDRWTPVDANGYDRLNDVAARGFVASGGTGETVQGRSFSARVQDVRGGATVRRSAGGATRLIDTAGVWIAVRVRWVARTEPTQVLGAELRADDGSRYRATDRVAQPLVGTVGQPGIPEEGDVLFELPRRAAAGPLTLRLSPRIDPRADSVLEIRLPAAGARTVDGWATSPEPIILVGPGPFT